MKKIVAVLTLALATTSALANGFHGGGYHRHGGGNWVVPAIVGGVVGYVISQPRTVIVQQQPPVVYQPTPVVVQPNQQICETKLMIDPWGFQRMATVCYQQ